MDESKKSQIKSDIKTQTIDKKSSGNSETVADGKLVVIRIRGIIGINRNIDKTLNQLLLYKKNCCVVIPNNKSYRGMVEKAKDYITWGNIDDKTFEMLIKNRSKEYKGRFSDTKQKIKYDKFLTVKDKKIKRFFRLNSPRKGYGGKGLKVPFSIGGALGYRADKINELVLRMI